MRRVKRHPTLGDGVTVGAGAVVLGPVTVGECAQIGANAVVVKDVPPHAVVVGVPGRVRRPSSPPPFDTYDMWADPAIYI